MNQKFTKFINDSKNFLGKHSPEILTGIGIVGMGCSVVTAVRATPKAMTLVEQKKQELDVNHLTPKETFLAVWKPYIPSVVTFVLSAGCIIGASTINYKRNAALGAAYALSERTLIRYRDKVIETLGEKKEHQIRDKVAQDDIDKNQPSPNQIIVTSKGNTLCKDMISGRYFRSDIETIKQTINKLNRRLTYDHYISLNEFYGELGLDDIKNGDLMGWNLDNGLIEPSFNACITENDEPCIVFDVDISPKYDFDKLI
ncbi:DUF6353 family protein [uncultured Eubacterium sp.]|uniref:DUF6353 family protein n=1 Tax=uncultured Eubacterium sp. TaxID=165185 RepID=UPI002599F7BE|nr:DUF6353 family protein [uncultured Eubacterium sp.]